MMPKTIGRILDLAVGVSPNRIAVSLGDDSMSFRECDARANRFAHSLIQNGLCRGDRLLFWSPINLDTFAIFVAAQRLGVVFVPVNPAFSIDEMIAMTDYVRPALLLVECSLAAQGEALKTRTGVPLATFGGPGAGIDLTAMAAHASGLADANWLVNEEDIHAIFLTSGSTGAPKGVMVSHRASWNRAFGGNSRHPASGGRGEVNMFPLFHWAGWHFSLCAWAHRRPIHLTPRADAASLNDIIEKWHPRYMYAIPAVWERLLDSAAFGRTGSLISVMTGTYRVEPDLISALRARLPGAQLTIGMGATELGMGTQIGDDDIDRKPYSVGQPAPGVEMIIQDGELCGRSDQMMSGYFDLPELTREVIRDGWYHTGDVAETDDEGFITITGRRREIIRSGGETIAPAEVEAVIARYPGVREVSIIGLPDRRWGEIVGAVLVLEDCAPLPSVDELRSFLDPQIAAFKQPRAVFQLPTLPRTAATGQIQRSLVRAAILKTQK